MKRFMAVVERCQDTGLYVGHIPGIPGAHSQGATLDDLQRNLKEVLEMLQEEGDLEPESEFVGTQAVTIERTSG